MTVMRVFTTTFILGLALWLICTSPATAQSGDSATTDDQGPTFAPDVRGQREQSATPPASRTSKPTRSKGIRTLDEITIEGEIAVPQVLFIMARERQRYQDRLHLLYLKSSLEIGNETAFPTEVVSRLRP